MRLDWNWPLPTHKYWRREQCTIGERIKGHDSIANFQLWSENARDYQIFSDYFGFGDSYAGRRQGLS